MSEPRRAFVVGHPVGHSRSPMIHEHWLSSHGIAGSYVRIDILPEELRAFLAGLAGARFVGGNVTIPHKEAALRAVERPTEQARRLGAVNTVWLDAEGRLAGDNTDGYGFVSNLDSAVADWESRTETALVIGAGGAAKAIVAALIDRGVPRVIVANRTLAAATSVAQFDSRRISPCSLAELGETLTSADLLINTTQLGMAGQAPLDLELERLKDGSIVADIVYVPLETPLLARARARGLLAVDGLGMLLHQAAPGFERWFGARPAITAELRDRLVASIEGRPV